MKLLAGDQISFVWAAPNLNLSGSVFDDGSTIIYDPTRSLVFNAARPIELNSLKTLTQWRSYYAEIKTNITLNNTDVVGLASPFKPLFYCGLFAQTKANTAIDSTNAPVINNCISYNL